MNALFIQLTFLLGDLPPDRFFGMDMQTVIQTSVNIVIVIILGIVLTKILYTPVRNFLSERTQRIQNQLDHARDSKATASELRAKYDSQLKDIDIERAAILDESRKLASEQREHILSLAKDEAKEIKVRASQEVEAERKRITDELHTAVIDISSNMAEKLLSHSIDKKAHDRLFAEGLAELEQVVFSG